MRFTPRCAFAVSLAMVVGIPAAASGASRTTETMLPSIALHAVFEQLREQPTKQGEIAKQILARTQTTGLDSGEAFALAELYFVALMPKEASRGYQAFAGWNDQRARTAQQRIIFMKMVAFQQFDGIADDLAAYRRKFPPISTDLFGLAEPIGVLAAHLRDEGKYEEVVNLVTQEVNGLPAGAPFLSYGLVASNVEAFKKAGQQDAAVRLLKRALAAFDAIADAPTPVPTGPVAHRAGVIHRVEQKLRLDYSPERAHDDSLISAKAKTKDALAKLVSATASARRPPAHARVRPLNDLFPALTSLFSRTRHAFRRTRRHSRS